MFSILKVDNQLSTIPLLMILKSQIIDIFCMVNEFMIEFNREISNKLIGNATKRKPTMSSSEVITIMILFQLSLCRHFKAFYFFMLQSI